MNVVDPRLFRSGDIHSVFASLRRDDPVHFETNHPLGPYWSVCDYETIVDVERRFSEFTSKDGISIEDGIAGLRLGMLITEDPPIHAQLRKSYNVLADPKWLQSISPRIVQAVVEVLARLDTNVIFDASRRFARPIPALVMTVALNLEFAAWHLLARWADAGVNSLTMSPLERRSGLSECWAFFEPRLKVALTSEFEAGLIGRLVMAIGEPITPERYLGHLILLLVGGLDTIRNTLLGSLVFASSSTLFERLKRDEALIRPFLDEVVRLQSPLAHMRRTALVDTQLGGKQVRKGDKVLLWYVSGNRDEAVFDNPNRIELLRTDRKPSLSFGWGVHRCVGARLAMMTLETTWMQILHRFSRIEITSPPVRTLSTFVNGYDALFLRLESRS